MHNCISLRIQHEIFLINEQACSIMNSFVKIWLTLIQYTLDIYIFLFVLHSLGLLFFRPWVHLNNICIESCISMSEKVTMESFKTHLHTPRYTLNCPMLFIRVGPEFMSRLNKRNIWASTREIRNSRSLCRLSAFRVFWIVRNTNT